MLKFNDMTFSRKDKIENIRIWAIKHEKYLSPLFFFGGAVLDNLTLTRIDRFFDNIILLSYLVVSIVVIVLINLFQSKEIQNKWTQLLPLITQFTFGGLFSGFAIFYTKSASLTTSWIFLLIIYGIFIANERFRKYYEKIDFQIQILFVAIFSYMIFFIPVILKKMNALIFIFSGVLSLVIVYGLIVFFYRYVSNLGSNRGIKLVKNIFYIYIVFNIMYFTNIIPPVPLSLKHLEVYNYVEKSAEGNYLVREEKISVKEIYKDWFNDFHRLPESPVYVYASVFAPTDLNTEIIHIWQRYDEKDGKWQTVNEIKYPVKGGRDQGYRGYSVLYEGIPGKYRVYVKNVQGQTLGKIKFTVTESEELDLKTESL